MSTDYTPETITIQLTKGQSTVIDAKHADLTEKKWCVFQNQMGAYYAVRNIPKPDWEHQGTELLHRVILSRKLGRELLRHELCDHANKDTLDNREENLRLASFAQNMHNTKRRKDNSSGYKGVCWDKRKQKWVARITANKITKYLGYYNTAEEAHEAYRKAAPEYHGEFARLE